MSGKKFDDGKLRYDLVPPAVLKQLATVLTFGAKKYGANNWQTVPDSRDRYYAAMMRHVEADRGGEVFDEESGLPHLTHALACVAFMLHNTLATVSEPGRCSGCKVPPEFEPLLEWLGPVDSIKFLDNADDLPAIADMAPIEFINCAFDWAAAPEGFGYWSAVAEKWCAHLDPEVARNLAILATCFRSCGNPKGGV